MNNITLRGHWLVKAPVAEVAKIVTDFERYPDYFPKVAESARITKREGNLIEIEATAKSFGQTFPVTMRTQILPGRGFISDNDSPKFGTSGHEQLLLSPHPAGTAIDYTYQVSIHKPLLRLVATPLIKWYSMHYWERAVIDNLKRIVES